MTNINWIEEVHKRKEALIKDTQAFLQIKSVYDEASIREGAPMGQGIAAAMDHLLHKAQQDGFSTKNVDGYAGHIEYGAGKEIVGVLCHVDVVPEGEGWTSAPFSAEIREGKIYARGAIDDKGPTMATYYALKIVKELGIQIDKRVRIIIGTDEESNWQCVRHYFKQEEMPDIGFAPDADFPIIYAEKGIANFFLTRMSSEQPEVEEDDSVLQLKSFHSGLRVNMVPDQAEAIIQLDINSKNNINDHIDNHMDDGTGVADRKLKGIVEHFKTYIQEKSIEGSIAQEGNQLRLLVKGSSAHGAEPHKGRNAGFLLISFLKKLELIGADHSFIKLVDRYFSDDFHGEKLDIAICDEMTGALTINVGVLHYSRGLEAKLGLNLRYPVSTNYEEMMTRLEKIAEEFGFAIRDMDNSPPHHVDKHHPLIKILQRVYQQQTGEEARLLSIGGGTYARSLKSGVAFGPLFPGKEETAHQKDEYVEIEDLLKATAIYAQAIYELAIDKETIVEASKETIQTSKE